MRRRFALYCRSLRPLLAVLLIVVAFDATVSRTSFALGTVTPQTRELTEGSKGWKLNLTVNLGRAPAIAHVPMTFEFTATALYERALTDKSPETPVLNKIPLSNQQGIFESLDVGFSDGTGKVFSTTKFDFVIRRDRGFEAGEYTLKIKQSSDGVTIGQPLKLILQGDNPVIDRRAIVFAGEKKEPKKKAVEPSEADKATETEPKAEVASETPAATAALNEPPRVAPKQGGCGCSVPGDAPGQSGAALVFGLGLGLVLLRRR